MIISNEAAEKRLSSPGNLINKMQAQASPVRSKAMSLFGIGASRQNQTQTHITTAAPSSIVQPEAIPSHFLPSHQAEEEISEAQIPEVMNSEETIEVDNIIDEADTKIKMELAQTRAVDTLLTAVTSLKDKLPEMNANQLSSVADRMSKVIQTIQNGRKDQAVKTFHLHLYNPTQRKLTDFDSVEV